MNQPKANLHDVFPQVYTIDLETGQQTAFGYLGTKEGQLQCPASLLADDRSGLSTLLSWCVQLVILSGHLVVCDSTNHRLSVYSGDGTFLQVVDLPPVTSTPFGLARWVSTAWLVSYDEVLACGSITFQSKTV